MDFKANSGIWGTMFGVPCIVADNFLKLADEAQIKVLLYLLRFSGKSVTSEEISVNTGVPVSQVTDAVMFWKQVNVISQESEIASISPIQPQILKAPESVEKTVETVSEKNNDSASTAAANATSVNTSPNTKKPYINPSEISAIIQSDNNIAELFTVAESLLGTLNPSMQNSLIWMHNYLGLKKEVILILIGYCVDKNKTNASYIDKIAASWAENEINSLETATAEVERLNNEHTYINEVKRIFELRQNPTTNQQKFISQWQSAGFSTELLRYAYEKTVEQINKVSFEYINKILVSWKENGFKSPEDVKNAEEEYKKKRRNDSPASSDGFNADKYKIFINNI